MKASPSHFIPKVSLVLRALRQYVGLAVVLLVVASPLLGASTDQYTFTDPQGRTLVAKIISVAQPDVYLQVGGGVPFPVKIGAFSAKDQTYIRQWALDNQKSAQPFNIVALKDLPVDSSGGPPQQGFKVSLKNLSGKNLVNLRIEYVVLRQPSPNATAPLPRINGLATITSLVKNGEASIDTNSISVRGSRLAVWVRIYDAAGVLLQEWSSAPGMTDLESWDSGKSAKHGS